MYQLNLDIAHFLEHYWQKRPLSSGVAFHRLSGSHQPGRAGGSAMEEVVESRLVTRFKTSGRRPTAPSNPTTIWGRELGSAGAGLQTTGYPRYNEPAQPFQFIPGWRFDDVMVSFSTHHGGVGPTSTTTTSSSPRARAERHWRVGDATPRSEFATHAALLHCEPFRRSSTSSWSRATSLHPARIPRGLRHRALLNFSVGFLRTGRQGAYLLLRRSPDRQRSAHRALWRP